MTITEVRFKEEPEDDKPEPLRMEHFHLPLGMWMIGIVISLLCFIAEIIKHRKTNVPMARLESSVESESENLGEVFHSDMEAAELDLAGSEDTEDTKV